MAYINSYPMRGLPPKALLHLMLVVGLAVFVYAIITQNLLVATVVIFSPLAIITIGYGLQKPRFIYLMYATYAFFFTTVSRYIVYHAPIINRGFLCVHGVYSLFIFFSKNSQKMKS